MTAGAGSCAAWKAQAASPISAKKMCTLEFVPLPQGPLQRRRRCYDGRMKLAVACDHGGFPLKSRVIDELRKLGHDVADLGTNSAESVDYPDYAKAVAEAVLQHRAERAILICGSGAGACVAANKFRGIRSAT